MREGESCRLNQLCNCRDATASIVSKTEAIQEVDAIFIIVDCFVGVFLLVRAVSRHVRATTLHQVGLLEPGTYIFTDKIHVLITK